MDRWLFQPFSSYNRQWHWDIVIREKFIRHLCINIERPLDNHMTNDVSMNAAEIPVDITNKAKGCCNHYGLINGR